MEVTDVVVVPLPPLTPPVLGRMSLGATNARRKLVPRLRETPLTWRDWVKIRPGGHWEWTARLTPAPDYEWVRENYGLRPIPRALCGFVGCLNPLHYWRGVGEPNGPAG